MPLTVRLIRRRRLTSRDDPLDTYLLSHKWFRACVALSARERDNGRSRDAVEDHSPVDLAPKKQAADRLCRIGTEAGIVRRASVHRLMARING
jgi:hypothetical protein